MNDLIPLYLGLTGREGEAVNYPQIACELMILYFVFRIITTVISGIATVIGSVVASERQNKLIRTLRWLGREDEAQRKAVNRQHVAT